jgi:GNAT superfamily N-acetyltransferase
MPCQVRVARVADAPAIRNIFVETYGGYYPFEEYYDVEALTRIILGEGSIILVCEEEGTGRVLGTASVLLDIGAHSDLAGEFARLAVLPELHGRGIGGKLMEDRLRRVRNRLHIGIVDARTVHRHSIGIAQRNGFAPVGFSPMKDLFRERESTSIHAQWFGDSLNLRRNHPRIIAEVQPLASLAMDSAKIPVDVVVDDTAAPYPHSCDFTIEECTSDGYLSLLRIERGRTRHREVFGPMRLHYGFFRIQAAHAHYLIASQGTRIAGAIGFIRNDHEKAMRIFELISPDDQAVHFLLAELDRRCREEWDIAYVEIDIGADAPRMQRTVTELGFVPSTYIPAMVFQDVERLDVVRMVRLYVAADPVPEALRGTARAIADLVVASASEQQTLPTLHALGEDSPLFRGLTEEQLARLAGICSVEYFLPGATILQQGSPGDALLLILDGAADVFVDEPPKRVGTAVRGEALGEMCLLGAPGHTASVLAAASAAVCAARMPFERLATLMRRRPDIGAVIYRNLATGLGEKLRRADRQCAH